MDAGLAAAMAGLQSSEKSLDVWANDLANANTPAFAPQQPITAELAVAPLPQGAWPGMSRQTPNALSVGAGSELVATPRAFGRGGFVATGVPTDAAIEGPGFFVVGTPAGPAYTRDGAFAVDANGTLVTQGGAPVLSTSLQPIQVGAGSVSIGADGTVTAGGRSVGQLAVATFPNPQGLLALGQGLFVPGPATQNNAGNAAIGPVANGSRIQSGVLEGSGTDVAQGLVAIVDAARTFELNAKAAGQADKMLGWAASLA